MGGWANMRKKLLTEITNTKPRVRPPPCPQQSAGPGSPKAVGKITDDVDELLAFYDYHPTEHWQNLRSTPALRRSTSSQG
jgi:putative transposase